ncbi:MAG: protoporphyrinogen oxidase [Acidobacteriota bacterium]|nr:protoporphyrinogen oxidase [Acidobacteriota bacterium]
MSGAPHIVVVGGGITGLAAAQRLCRPGVRVTIVESDARLGGKIRTEQFAGRALDSGAEALLTRVPEALALCHELGLEHELVAPAQDRAFVWLGGRLRPLPPRLMAGAPGSTRALISARILSPLGLARAGLDLVLPSRAPASDVSIGRLVRRRLGRQVLERLVDPLLGGIHAGICDRLSLRATAPQLEAAVGSGRGLVRGLRLAASDRPTTDPVFLTLRGGLDTLVAALHARLTEIDVRTGAAVEALTAMPGGRLRLDIAGGAPLFADRAVLAAPAYATADIIAQACPEAARELREIGYASVASVLLAFPPWALAAPLDGSGFLVPRNEGRLLTACTWSSAKWPHLGGDRVLIKAAVGHAGDGRTLELDDESLIERAQAELGEAIGLRARADQARVVRFPRALPQYEVGHLERLTRIHAALAALPTVQLAGAAYRGVGVGACLRDGQRAAERIAATLTSGENGGLLAGSAAAIPQRASELCRSAMREDAHGGEPVQE